MKEYWGSGFSIPEYCELKELSLGSARRWIRIFEKEREGSSTQGGKDEIELVEVKQVRATSMRSFSGVNLKIGGVEILPEKDFDGSTLSEVLKVLGMV